MNKKLVCAVIAIVAVIGIIAGCAEKPAPEEPEGVKPTVAPTAPPTVAPTAPPSMVMGTSCEMCHKTESTAELNAHVTGGLLVAGKPGCFNYWGCHGVDNGTVHTVHPPEFGCAACHGTETPTIPPKGAGGTTCELCHAEPYPLEPSDGRLVEIHLDRGRDCTVCHVGEISEIHGLE